MLDHLRALLIIGHLVAVTLIALPSVKGLRPAHLRHPEAQQAIETLSAMSGVPAEDVAQRVLTVGNSLNAGRRSVLRPFQPYYTYAGTRQSWRMFGVINHRPARLEVALQARTGASWTPLYISGVPQHRWRATTLEHVRFRSMMSSFSFRRDRPTFRVFAAWLAAQATLEGMDGTLRVQMRPCPIPKPAALRDAGARSCGDAYWAELQELP